MLCQQASTYHVRVPPQIYGLFVNAGHYGNKTDQKSAPKKLYQIILRVFKDELHVTNQVKLRKDKIKMCKPKNKYLNRKQ